MALKGEGFMVVGLSLFGHGPVDGMHLDLAEGLTALYGLNGAGKSTILRSVGDVLGGISRLGNREKSCIHIALDEDVEEDNQPLGTFLKALRTSLAEPLGPTEPGWDDQFISLVSKLIAQINQTESAVEDSGNMEEQDDPPANWLWTDPYVESNPVVFSLIPSGTPRAPEWDVYLSAQFTDEMREGAQAISDWWAAVMEEDADRDELVMNRPEATGWLTGDRHWDPKVLNHSLQLAPALHWPLELPIPMRRLSKIRTPPVLVNQPLGIEELNADTRRSVLSERKRAAGGSSLVGLADQSTMVLADWLTRHQENLERRANTLYQKTFRDPPQLLLDLKTPDQWFTGEAPEWRARRGAAEFPFDRLSNSQQRWASLSISSVLAQRDATRPSLLIIDEPESGLHRSAEAILPGAMRALVDNGSSVLTATHSPALLSSTDKSRTRLLHVAMAEGHTLPPIPLELDVAGSLRNLALTSGLGLTAADLLTQMRVAVWVEGEHDVAVLRHFLGQELADAGAHLFPLHGATKAPALADAGVLLDVTDATLVIIVDNVDGRRARELWDRAQAHAEAGNDFKAKATLAQLKKLHIAEGYWLADLGMRALELARLHRIVALPLTQFDIACYLPVGLLVPGGASWEQLHDEYERLNPKTPNRPRATFKNFLLTSRNSPITTATIKNAINQMSEVPEEIQLLGANIKRLGLLPPSDPLETTALDS